MPIVADIVQVLEQFAPTISAASWDNVGLLLGDRNGPAKKVLTCLTVTPDVADEAASIGTDLIVTHHPIFFRGPKRLTIDTAEGRVALTLAKAAIAVYSPHTAFDDCPGGINDQLASRIGLQDVQPLRVLHQEQFKFVVFVPEADLAKVSSAIFAAGAGAIGQYRECSFRAAGTGTFLPGDGANPTIGKKGQREEVAEWRLETMCTKQQIDGVIAAMRAAHSYEEPAFEVYSLFRSGRVAGSGRIGAFDKPQSLEQVAQRLRASLTCGPVQVVGDSGREVNTIAIACGSAGEFLDDARRAGAEAFLTGELRFHDYLAAQAANIGLILPGHYATERFAVEWLADWLQKQFPGLSANASAVEQDPVSWI